MSNVEYLFSMFFRRLEEKGLVVSHSLVLKADGTIIVTVKLNDKLVDDAVGQLPDKDPVLLIMAKMLEKLAER